MNNNLENNLPNESNIDDFILDSEPLSKKQKTEDPNQQRPLMENFSLAGFSFGLETEPQNNPIIQKPTDDLARSVKEDFSLNLFEESENGKLIFCGGSSFLDNQQQSQEDQPSLDQNTHMQTDFLSKADSTFPESIDSTENEPTEEISVLSFQCNVWELEKESNKFKECGPCHFDLTDIPSKECSRIVIRSTLNGRLLADSVIWRELQVWSKNSGGVVVSTLNNLGVLIFHYIKVSLAERLRSAVSERIMRAPSVGSFNINGCLDNVGGDFENIIDDGSNDETEDVHKESIGEEIEDVSKESNGEEIEDEFKDSNDEEGRPQFSDGEEEIEEELKEWDDEPQETDEEEIIDCDGVEIEEESRESDMEEELKECDDEEIEIEDDLGESDEELNEFDDVEINPRESEEELKECDEEEEVDELGDSENEEGFDLESQDDWESQMDYSEEGTKVEDESSEEPEVIVISSDSEHADIPYKTEDSSAPDSAEVMSSDMNSITEDSHSMDAFYSAGDNLNDQSGDSHPNTRGNDINVDVETTCTLNDTTICSNVDKVDDNHVSEIKINDVSNSLGFLSKSESEIPFEESSKEITDGPFVNICSLSSPKTCAFTKSHEETEFSGNMKGSSEPFKMDISSHLSNDCGMKGTLFELNVHAKKYSHGVKCICYFVDETDYSRLVVSDTNSHVLIDHVIEESTIVRSTGNTLIMTASKADGSLGMFKISMSNYDDTHSFYNSILQRMSGSCKHGLYSEHSKSKRQARDIS